MQMMAPAPGPWAAPPGPRPRRIDHVIVPLDGSPFAERALPVARWLAGETGARVDLLEVVPPSAAVGAGALDADLRGRQAPAGWQVAAGDDPAEAIVGTAGADDRSLVCLATHGRDRSAAILGSVAAGVLSRSERPVILVGPDARPAGAGDAAVVAAVEGHAEDLTVVAAGAGWAARLGRPLLLVTVAEPAPRAYREDHPPRRARGPRNPDDYLAWMALHVPAGCGVGTRVEYDPISVHTGLARAADRTAALLVVGRHRRSWAQRAVLGSHPARVVHDAEVPVLVVPLVAAG